MAVTGHGASVGIPVVLLYEAEGLTITVESVKGELYRGFLDQTDDSMNLLMKNVSRTDVAGDVAQLEQVYLRGSVIKFVVFPAVLQHSPMFKRVLKFKESHRRYIPQGAGAERAGLQAGGGRDGPPARSGPRGRGR